jgi:hypothetical protein
MLVRISFRSQKIGQFKAGVQDSVHCSCLSAWRRVDAKDSNVEYENRKERSKIEAYRVMLVASRSMGGHTGSARVESRLNVSH